MIMGHGESYWIICWYHVVLYGPWYLNDGIRDAMDIKQMGCNGYLHGLVRSSAGVFAGVCLKFWVPKNSVISLITLG